MDSGKPSFVVWACRFGLVGGLVWCGILLERFVLDKAEPDPVGSGRDPASAGGSDDRRATPLAPISALDSPARELEPYVSKFAAFLERFPGGEVILTPTGDIRFDPTPTDLSLGYGAPPFITRGSEVFGLVDRGFSLTPQAIKALSLNDDETNMVQTALNKLRDDYQAAFAERAKPDPLRTDADSGVYAFLIPAFIEESEQMIEDFGASMAEGIGERRSQRLLDIFNMPNHFASLGTQDVFVKIRETEMFGSMRLRAEWELRHPTTGKMRQRTTTDLDQFEEQFGKIFSVEDIPESDP